MGQIKHYLILSSYVSSLYAQKDVFLWACGVYSSVREQRVLLNRFSFLEKHTSSQSQKQWTFISSYSFPLVILDPKWHRAYQIFLIFDLLPCNWSVMFFNASGLSVFTLFTQLLKGPAGRIWHLYPCILGSFFSWNSEIGIFWGHAPLNNFYMIE